MKKYRDVALNTDARAEAMLAEELETEESAEGENAEVENAEAVSADAVNESLENEETVGLSNICYTPINKFPQNSLW